VFNIDIQTCSVRGGAMRIIACIEDAVVIEKILAHLDAKAAAAQAARPPLCQAPPARPFGSDARPSVRPVHRGFSPLAAVASRPRQGIGCAQGAARSGSRRGPAGLARAEAVAAVISATEAGPTSLPSLRRRFCSPGTERDRHTQARAGRFIRPILLADTSGPATTPSCSHRWTPSCGRAPVRPLGPRGGSRSPRHRRRPARTWRRIRLPAGACGCSSGRAADLARAQPRVDPIRGSARSAGRHRRSSYAEWQRAAAVTSAYDRLAFIIDLPARHSVLSTWASPPPQGAYAGVSSV
jgi:hypothetical protein